MAEGTPVTEDAKGKETEPMPITWSEYRATAILFLSFVITMVVALALATPFDDAELEAFEDTGDPTNAVLYIAMIIAFTFVILWIAKKGYKKVIQFIILGSVAGVVLYLGVGLLTQYAGMSYNASALVGLAFGLAMAIWLYFKPEWYVIDLVGLMVASVAATIFGISFEPLVTILLLVLLAVYDAIAVYKTKHMLSLADTVIDLRLPVLMVVPKHLGYSFRQETTEFKNANKENKGEREAMFMGLGDLVMPSILVVSAFVFMDKFGWSIAPTIGAAVGTFVGFGALMAFVLRGNPQAGLPLLNGGAIAGFLGALAASEGTLVFW